MKKFTMICLLVIHAFTVPVFAESVLMTDEETLCDDENVQIKLTKDFTYEITEYGTLIYDGKWEWEIENQSIILIYESDGNTLRMQIDITEKVISRDYSRVKIIELMHNNKIYKESNCY